MKSPSQDEAEAQSLGSLQVELPHWSAKVNVYDNLYRALPSSELKVEHFEGSNADGVTATLATGVYKVEVTLGNNTESKLVLVRADHPAQIRQTEWSKKMMDAAKPLAKVQAARPLHIQHAEKLSQTLTWQGSPGGDSRLFLFVRTDEPTKKPAFADGLALYNLGGEEITEFKSGVKHNKRGGWLAFNADLPSGYYILRRSRKGVYTRNQPLYLCAGWETQIFLVAINNYPSLSTMSMNMAERGAGYHSDSEVAIAAEAVLDDMRHGSRAGLVTREKIGNLLRGKLENPWLGILAGYALLRFRKANDSRYESLISHVLNSLQRIDDHPDARAIQLGCSGETVAPFWVPPLLHDGLQIVRDYAENFTDTIPLQSLTDLVIPNLLVNSPWVAWRKLDGKPRLNAPASDMPSRAVKPKARKAFTPNTGSYTEAFVQAASPRLPVYRLPATSEEAKAQSTATTTVGTYAAPATISTLLTAPLLQAVQELILRNDPESLPERMTINGVKLLNEMLEQVSAVDISEKSGISLLRAEQGLAGLRQVGETVSTQVTSENVADELLTADEKAVFEYVVQQSGQRQQPATGAASAEAAAVAQASTGLPEPVPFTIEESIAQIRSAAARLSMPNSAVGGNAEATALTSRLRRIADTLFARADFIIITDTNSKMYYANGVFLSLLSASIESKISASELKSKGIKEIDAWRRAASEERLQNQRVWEAALTDHPAGVSTLVDPLAKAPTKEWTLRRTVIVDEATQREVAYLNNLHYVETPGLTIEILDLFEERISSLTLYSSKYAYGSTGNQKALVEVEALVSEFEQALQGD